MKKENLYDMNMSKDDERMAKQMYGYDSYHVYVDDKKRDYFNVMCKVKQSYINGTHTMCYYNGDYYYYDGKIYRRDDDMKCFDYVGILGELCENDSEFPKSDNKNYQFDDTCYKDYMDEDDFF